MARSGFRIGVGLAAGLLLQAGVAPSAQAQWRVAAFLGSASNPSSSIHLIQPASATDLIYEPIAWDDESFVPPVYYGYRIGRSLPFAPRLSIEAEFVHLKMFADTSATARVRGTDRGVAIDRREAIDRTLERFSISHGVNFVFVNAVYRLPMGPAAHPRLTLTARGGAGPTVPHGESTIRGESRDQYELGALGWQASGGLEVRIAGGFHALMDYKYTRTRQTVGVAGGTAGTLLRTHHVVFGAGYEF